VTDDRDHGLERRVGGRAVTPDGVLGGDADCEAQLDYVLALYLGRDDFCSILIEDVLLDRLSHDKKRNLLGKMLRRHALTEPPYKTLVEDLRKLRDFRNELAHTVGRENDPWQRIRRRAGQNFVSTITEPEVVEQLERAMLCQSALNGLRFYLADRPAVDPPATDPPPLFA
jgi:hypothetical protein